jgi:hypothetical protein
VRPIRSVVTFLSMKTHRILLVFSLVAAGTLGLQAQTAPASPAATPTPSPRAPLMAGLDQLGAAQPLDALGLNIYGYAEGGYFYDASAPKSNGPTYIGFNSFKNTAILDKIDLTFERTVDPTKKQFDIGYHAEGIWGADAALIHSNGMGDTQTGRNQGDIVQAYVDFAAPGIPLRVRVGKWIELAGFEQFSANIYGAFGDPSRALYSYSYQFLYAEPGTQTGILATYVLNGQWSFDAGATRGWNQSLHANKGNPDFLGRITWTPSDKTAVIFVMTEGPEFPAGVGPNQPPRDNSDLWTALDLVVTQKVTDNLSLGLGFDYVYSPHIPGVGSGQQWGGVAGYVSYAIDPHFTFNTRLEWYGDRSGFGSGATGFGIINFYEATVGLAIKPLPKDTVLSHLLIRPEIRYDDSDRPAFGRGDRNRLSLAVGVLFTF